MTDVSTTNRLIDIKKQNAANQNLLAAITKQLADLDEKLELLSNIDDRLERIESGQRQETNRGWRKY